MVLLSGDLIETGLVTNDGAVSCLGEEEDVGIGDGFPDEV
jgi:hypothetical protein